jgi:peroxiredoxin
MKRLFLSLLVAFCATSALAMMKPGTSAPDFTIEAAQGGAAFTFSLKDALKKGPVVLYFYPKSFTSVCTVEAHEFAEAMDEFAAMNASVIGVSGDSIDIQKEFSKKECRDKFPVGADSTFHVIKAYDAAFELPLAGPVFADRISYVISQQGKIISAIKDSGAHAHIENALKAIKELTEKKKL